MRTSRETDQADQAAAERAWRALCDAGGLVTVSEIAEAWGVHPETVRTHYSRREQNGFPAPVDRLGRTDVWLAAAVARWRALDRRPGRRRRGSGVKERREGGK